MKVLMLGATGLLGHNVLRRLQDEGHRVVALVRDGGSLQVEHAGVEVMECHSLANVDMLRRAAAGCDAVINCAGVTDMSLLRRRDYELVNCQLCRNLLFVMQQVGVRRLVHVSTVNTIGYGSAERPADESAPMQSPFTASFYADSKREGEVAVLGARQPEVIVVNPGFMLGPYDVKPSSGRLLLAAYRKPLMFAPKGGKAFVHVGDVAQAVVNALTRGKPGSRYIAVNSHACLSLRELYRLQAEVCGYRQAVVAVPDWVLLAAGRVGDVLRWMGVRTQVSTVNVRQLMVREYYDNGRARRELGLQETPVAVAIKDFYEWRKNRQ